MAFIYCYGRQWHITSRVRTHPHSYQMGVNRLIAASFLRTCFNVHRCNSTSGTSFHPCNYKLRFIMSIYLIARWKRLAHKPLEFRDTSLLYRFSAPHISWTWSLPSIIPLPLYVWRWFTSFTSDWHSKSNMVWHDTSERLYMCHRHW